MAAVRATAPQGDRRMSANPHANGGLLRRSLELPGLDEHAVPVKRPGGVKAESTRVMRGFLRDVMALNRAAGNFRIVGPDGDGLEPVAGCLRGDGARLDGGDPSRGCPSGSGRQGSGNSIRAYVPGLAGRLPAYRAPRLFSCYEAFTHIVDSMFSQHREMAGCLPQACLAAADRLAELSVVQSCLAAGAQWLQPLQDPGFIDVALNKKADVVRVYLPADANSLLCVTDHVA
ncbi:hypothetical protein ACVOMV_16120 [Mesorhizobium atlanticum]